MSTPANPTLPASLPAEHTPARDALDILAVLAVMYLVRPIASYFGFHQNIGAVSIVASVAASTWLLHRKGESWRSLGWRRPEHIGVAVAWTIGTTFLLLAVLPVILEPVGNVLGLPPQHLERLGDLQTDTVRYLVLLLPLGWGTAAFGEELLFRGFFNTRLIRLFGRGRLAVVFAAFGQAALFGLVHWYLGPLGVLNAFAIGLVSAAVYSLNGRNLWPLIIAHGLVDTFGLTMLRLGVAHTG
jgi:membrane protease YdiL (CAAX protease family)